MNNPIPELINIPIENKIVFYQKYIPDYISTFNNYLSELQLCLDFNYYNCNTLQNKINNIVTFYNNIISKKFQIDKIDIIQQQNEYIVKSNGIKTLNKDFILFWLDKFTTLTKNIQDQIVSNDNNKIKINELSNSIGHLSFYRNAIDNNTSPYYDLFNEYTPLNIPVGKAVFNKILPVCLKSIVKLEYKTNIILKRNLINLQSGVVKTTEIPMIPTGKGYSSLPHGENLITDIGSFVNIVQLATSLNTILATQLDVMFNIIKQLSDVNKHLNKHTIPKYEFTNLDVEGNKIAIDIYNNKI